jgi:glycosyltransferase involved in cell wall biosynthesis
MTRAPESVASGRPSLTILGVHVAGDAYPSVEHRVRALLQSREVAAREINHPLAEPLSQVGHPSPWLRPFRVVAFGLRLMGSHVRAIVGFLRARTRGAVYVPYPSILVLYLLSLLPGRRRPARVSCDAFISIYDTVVHDRRLVPAASPLAAALRHVEARAYRFADRVIVDTPLNADWMAKEFEIDVGKFVAIPLPINERAYRRHPYRSRPGVCTVLFVGTFVPLQGAEVVARAAVLLSGDDSLRFRIIGNGQTADRVADILAASPSVHCEWDRAWKSADELSQAIQRADICLGIFGEGDKAQRVWPLKNYAAMAVGRPLITGDTRCARAILAESSAPPFAVAPVGDAGALADAIRFLSRNPRARDEYARRAGAVYDERLASSVWMSRLHAVVTGSSVGGAAEGAPGAVGPAAGGAGGDE